MAIITVEGRGEKMETKLMTDYAIRINGEEVAYEDATISIFDHGFLFGDSIYVVVRTVNGVPFALDEHLLRLRNSAKRLSFDFPWTNEDLRNQILKVIEAKKWQGDSYVRMIITRGIGRIDLMPRTCENPTLIVIAKEIPELRASLHESGQTICITEVRRNSRQAMDPGIKSGNYLNNVLALIEARGKGADDAVMLNEDDHLTEATTSNFYIVKDGVIKTPSIDCGILPGITRGLLIKVAKEGGIPIEETKLTLDDLENADEVFVSGTIKGVVPVRKVIGLANWEGEPGPVTEKLRELYYKFAGL
jgi:branched-chain amino acid aminotransferase